MGMNAVNNAFKANLSYQVLLNLSQIEFVY